VYLPRVGYVLQVSGGKLSEELLELLPDYAPAFGDGGGGGGAGGGGAPSANPATAAAAAAAASAATAAPSAAAAAAAGDAHYYSTSATRSLSRRYGDLLYKVADLEVSVVCGGLCCAVCSLSDDVLLKGARTYIPLSTTTQPNQNQTKPNNKNRPA
jgi:hypothetical protein